MRTGGYFEPARHACRDEEEVWASPAAEDFGRVYEGGEAEGCKGYACEDVTFVFFGCLEELGF